MKTSLDLEIRLSPGLVRQIEAAGQGGLRQHVERVFARSQSAVPVATGALKSSGRVERIPRGYAIAYGDPENINYARHVHQDQGGNGFRFLANPAITGSRTLGRDVAGAIKVGVRQPPLKEAKGRG